jgi:hypothetical protein
MNTDIDGSQIVILSRAEAEAVLWAFVYLNDNGELGETQYRVGIKLARELGLSSDLLRTRRGAP